MYHINGGTYLLVVELNVQTVAQPNANLRYLLREFILYLLYHIGVKIAKLFCSFLPVFQSNRFSLFQRVQYVISIPLGKLSITI